MLSLQITHLKLADGKKKNHTHCTDEKNGKSVFGLHNPTPCARRFVKRSNWLEAGAGWAGNWILEQSAWEGARPVEEEQEGRANVPAGDGWGDSEV